MKLLEVRSGNKEKIEEHLANLPSALYVDEPVTTSVLGERMYHGSPICPENMGLLLMPQQARTGTAKRGEEIDHGRKGISVSAHPYLPIARSIIHERGSALANVKTYPLMGVIPNKNLDRFIFTNTDVYSALRRAKAVGYLYGIEQAPSEAYLFEPERYRGRHHEIRIPVSASWDWVAEVGLDDLPHDILVTPAEEARLDYFDAFRETYPGHPLELAKNVGLEVMRLGDYLAQENEI